MSGAQQTRPQRHCGEAPCGLVRLGLHTACQWLHSPSVGGPGGTRTLGTITSNRPPPRGRPVKIRTPPLNRAAFCMDHTFEHLQDEMAVGACARGRGRRARPDCPSNPNPLSSRERRARRMGRGQAFRSAPEHNRVSGCVRGAAPLLDAARPWPGGRLAACREQTELRIGACPVAHTDEEMGICLGALLSFTQQKPTVLYSKPQARISSKARGNKGSVAQRNRRNSELRAERPVAPQGRKIETVVV